MNEQMLNKLRDVKARKLPPMRTFEEEIKVIVEEWARAEGYVKMAPDSHCPTCTCGKHE